MNVFISLVMSSEELGVTLANVGLGVLVCVCVFASDVGIRH